MTHPSLWTRWLPRDAFVPTPRVIEIEDPMAGGFYLRPGAVWYLDDLELDGGQTGLIGMSSSHWTPWAQHHQEASVLAHEFRHHCQYWRGQHSLTKRENQWDRLVEKFPYEEAIREYLRRNAHERDAVRYEARLAPHSGLARWWLELLRQGTKT